MGWGKEVHPTALCISSEMDTFGLFSSKLPECKLQGFSSANTTQYRYFLFYEGDILSFYIHSEHKAEEIYSQSTGHIILSWVYSNFPRFQRKVFIQYGRSDYTTHLAASLVLCDYEMQGKEVWGTEFSALYTPHPPVNRDKFNLTEWFLVKAVLGAMETRQLSCQKGFFLFPAILFFLFPCSQVSSPGDPFYTSLL